MPDSVSREENYGPYNVRIGFSRCVYLEHIMRVKFEIAQMLLPMPAQAISGLVETN